MLSRGDPIQYMASNPDPNPFLSLCLAGGTKSTKKKTLHGGYGKGPSIHPSIRSFQKKKSEAPGSIILMMSTATVPFYIKRLDKRSVGSPGSRVKQTSPRIHVQESKSRTYHVCVCVWVRYARMAELPSKRGQKNGRKKRSSILNSNGGGRG